VKRHQDLRTTVISFFLLSALALNLCGCKKEAADTSCIETSADTEVTWVSELQESSESLETVLTSESTENPVTGETTETSESYAADPEAIQRLVEEIVMDYGYYGSEADERIDSLLTDLRAEDEITGMRWSEIMDLWRSPDFGRTLNYDVLPDGLPDTDELCIVVLGFQLNPDGTMRDELINRLNVALRSAEKYPNAYIVCTGGGTAYDNDSATEAGEMARWLEEQGIAKERIIVEDNSLTTAQNAIYTYNILTSDYPSVRYIAIVSSDYHIATGELLFTAEAVLKAPVPGEEKLKVISNASWDAPSGSLSAMFQAGALIELSGDAATAFEIYYDNYDIHELPALD